MAAQSENMLTVSMLLSVFFLPGVLTGNCYKPPTLFITAPEKIEALTGSCLQIPCSFNTKHKRFDSRRTVYGVWMKKSLKFSLNQNVVIFNSSESVNTYPLKMIGNLGEKNCTTLFPYLNTSYTDKYFFRVENGQFRATACAKPLQITVEDSPRSPSINVPSDLKEHQSVTLTCSAFTPCPHSPPQLTCNLQQDSVGKTEKNTDGTFTTKIQENITLSDTHDGYNITCSARYPVIGGSKTAGTEMTLSVSYAPKNTSASISPSGLVSAGSWVELSCSSRAKPPPRFTWFRISKHGDINVSSQLISVLSLRTLYFAPNETHQKRLSRCCPASADPRPERTDGSTASPRCFITVNCRRWARKLAEAGRRRFWRKFTYVVVSWLVRSLCPCQ
ncbi:myeloid cell surface antigen CD33-like [Poecilia formosa]|uniref:myeloid cell surface antigen CD33-like n=1 Tax=Poecilia formosa TaxID=48698 RepID=UPI0007BA2B60|nr:PREDICTED: myeloid cell surface antigen CD33-like [Poecilia formosa]